jgi:hypothetical protein
MCNVGFPLQAIIKPAGNNQFSERHGRDHCNTQWGGAHAFVWEENAVLKTNTTVATKKDRTRAGAPNVDDARASLPAQAWCWASPGSAACSPLEYVAKGSDTTRSSAAPYRPAPQTAMSLASMNQHLCVSP